MASNMYYFSIIHTLNISGSNLDEASKAEKKFVSDIGLDEMSHSSPPMDHAISIESAANVYI